MRLIDADNLEYDEVEVNGHWGRYEYVLYKRDIDASPTVDAVPVVRGKWANNRELSRLCCSSIYQCSECKQWIDIFQMSGEMNFCPNCGAYMKEEIK